jgi:histidyl-tRNA synthetase
MPEEREFIRYPQLFIAALGEGTFKEAYRWVNQLHLQGIRAELDYEGKSLKSQMRRADKLKAKYVLILGEDELKRGRAVLRNMNTKSQEEILIDNILEIMKNKVARD